MVIGEQQARLQHRRAAYRLELMQTRDGQGVVHHIGGQVWGKHRPLTGHQHGGQMPASRMSGHGDAARVATIFGDVAPHPGQGAHHLHGDVGHGHRRAQGVIGHDHRASCFLERRGHKGVVKLVQKAPVATVDEDQHRCIGAFRREDVQGFAAVGAVGHAGGASLAACQRRITHPALKVLAKVGDHRPVVVHAVVPVGVMFGGGHAWVLLKHQWDAAVSRQQLGLGLALARYITWGGVLGGL